MDSSKQARRRTASRARVGVVLSLVALWTLAPTLAGCGGGGGSAGGGPSLPRPLSISTRTLPAAGQDSPYELALAAEGGAPPYAWSLAPGSELPPGLSLSGTGLLYGVPTALGTWPFTARVGDAAAPTAHATAVLTLEVTSFRATVEGIRFGAAWTGTPYVVRATGSASTTFWIVENATGATLTAGSTLENTATYVAGPHAGTDTIAAQGSSGATSVLHVLVMEDPVTNLSARFGATDVWFLRFEGKFDPSHAFDSDWHAALATVGLRSPAGIGGTQTMADDIVDLYLRRQVLRDLNGFYGNAPDGTPSPAGLAISFPLEEPTPPYVAPPDGTVTAPAGNRYNVLSMIHGTDPSHFGTALQDSPFNTTQENDTSKGHGADEYGIFVNQVASFFVLTYHDEILPATPIGDADVPALLSLLYGHPGSGGPHARDPADPRRLRALDRGAGRPRDRSLRGARSHEPRRGGLDHERVLAHRSGRDLRLRPRRPGEPRSRASGSGARPLRALAGVGVGLRRGRGHRARARDAGLPTRPVRCQTCAARQARTGARDGQPRLDRARKKEPPETCVSGGRGELSREGGLGRREELDPRLAW